MRSAYVLLSCWEAVGLTGECEQVPLQQLQLCLLKVGLRKVQQMKAAAINPRTHLTIESETGVEFRSTSACGERWKCRHDDNVCRSKMNEPSTSC